MPTYPLTDPETLRMIRALETRLAARNARRVAEKLAAYVPNGYRPVLKECQANG